jgi:hypothetical protein
VLDGHDEVATRRAYIDEYNRVAKKVGRDVKRGVVCSLLIASTSMAFDKSFRTTIQLLQ